MEPLAGLKHSSEAPNSDGRCLLHEDGESSTHGLSGRVVRVGNYVGSDGTLVRYV